MYVYWIKTPDMTDPYTEGYIGVTNKQLETRLREHTKYTKRRSVVAKAISKHDDIEIVMLYEGANNDCLALEEQYRPNINIGWNIAKGGGLPSPMNEEKARKISQTLISKGANPYCENTHSKETIAKRKAAMIGRKWFHDPITLKSKLCHVCPAGWEAGRKPA